MKLNRILCSALVLPSIALFAAPQSDPGRARTPAAPVPAPKTDAERQQIIMEKVGGFVERERQGVVALVDAQTGYDTTALQASVAALAESIKTPIACRKGEFRLAEAEALRKAAGVDEAVYLVDDPSLPITLAAPEARWALVNLAPLKADSPDAAKLDKRVTKAFARAFVILNGGAMTKFTTSVLRPSASAAELDRIVYKGLPFDVIVALSKYLPEAGIAPSRRVTYKRACEEGWAPAPTNEFQKVIFERVRAEREAKPTNPIKIVPGQKPLMK